MLIFASDYHKAIYYASTKCASSALKQVLCRDINHKFNQKLSDVDLDNYFKFAVVRNPWDRLVYMYSNCIREFNPITNEPLDVVTRKYFNIERKNLDFKTFIHKVYENKYFTKLNSDYESFEAHFLPCDLFIPDDVNYIVKFISFKDDIKYVLDRLCLNIDIPIINKSEHEQYKFYYDSEDLDLVNYMYQKDIERFEFSYD